MLSGSRNKVGGDSISVDMANRQSNASLRSPALQNDRLCCEGGLLLPSGTGQSVSQDFDR